MPRHEQELRLYSAGRRQGLQPRPVFSQCKLQAASRRREIEKLLQVGGDIAHRAALQMQQHSVLTHPPAAPRLQDPACRAAALPFDPSTPLHPSHSKNSTYALALAPDTIVRLHDDGTQRVKHVTLPQLLFGSSPSKPQCGLQAKHPTMWGCCSGPSFCRSPQLQEYRGT